jgi:fatty acid/phospholipid biosynthesis enzyme
VDVVVTDGFTGNVALKTGEGAYKLMRDLLKQVFTSTIPARMGYLLARRRWSGCASGWTRAATTAPCCSASTASS